MQESTLCKLLDRLLTLPKESEWLEFKHNHADSKLIGEYISALSNSAVVDRQPEAFIVWGIEDGTAKAIGTAFDPAKTRVGGQALEMWLAQKLRPAPLFKFYAFSYNGLRIVLLSIRPIKDNAVKFDGVAYTRLGSHKTRLDDHPERLKEFWRVAVSERFEEQVAKAKVSAEDVLTLLDFAAYFDLINQPLPDRQVVIDRMVSEQFVNKQPDHYFDVTNLGAILFAKRLSDFGLLVRKAVRVILYKDRTRIQTLKERTFDRGYAAGFKELISFVNDQLPASEKIGPALRQEQKRFPEIAVRELVANALFHQDLTTHGDSAMIEIFADRVEITNPGKLLVDLLRIIDEPPRSRNELMAASMRRLNICEERGTGIDKVVDAVEHSHLPAPDFVVTQNHFKAVLYAGRVLSAMSRENKIRACYQHACLCHVNQIDMTNSSLRARFAISDENYPMVSRVINDTLDAKLIKLQDPSSKSRKFAKYVPFWA
jgi:ATP-dependent DNA helicase RecG